MKARTKLWLERITMAVIIIGLVFLCQPYSLSLYTKGFPILLFGTVAFIVATRLKAKED